tara:strand:+ start:2169 stop:3125 length:957 start_codon:yes stop_codon:yes gene_type:complete
MTCEIVDFVTNEYIPISPEKNRPEFDAPGLPLQEWQKRLFLHVFTPGPDGRFPYRTFVYSAPKKSGKTRIGDALCTAWARTIGGEVYILANGKDQAKDRAFSRIKAYIDYQEIHQPSWYAQYVQESQLGYVELKDPYSVVQPVPCNAGTQAGGFQTLTYWDEIWNYDREALYRLFSEMQPIPTVTQSMRLITTYAGYYEESELLWVIYKNVLYPDTENAEGEPTGHRVAGLEDLPVYRSEDGFTLVYWTHENVMPWQTDEYLESARHDPAIQLRPSEFLRLHENRWVAGVDSLIDMNQFDRLAQAGRQRGLAQGNVWA